jgi:DUF4097 and DUF4098 domain-containing protein YvlB
MISVRLQPDLHRVNPIRFRHVVPNMTIRHSVALVAILASGAVACDVRVNDKGGVSLDVSEGGRAEDESTQTYPLARGGRIELQTENGDVEFVAAAGPAVEVHSRRRARGRNDEAAKELLKQQYFTVEATPDRVSIRSVEPDGQEAFRRRVRTDYRISMPAGSVVTIKNENGAVTLTGVDGRFSVDSTNGRVMGRQVSGGLEMQMINGIVIVQMASVTADIKVTTVNGHAILGLPPDTNATVEATTLNGGVIVQDSLPIVATTKDRQRLSGRLGTGSGPKIELRTTNGNVRLGGGEPPT